MFSLKQYFTGGVIQLARAGTTRREHGIDYVYNSHGYRTHDTIKEHIVVSGCSHTEGVGLHYQDIWPCQLEKQLNTQVINIALGSSNSDFVSQNLALWCTKHTPKAVIAQWPNVFRSIHWNNSTSVLVNANISDELFRQKLLQGQENFLLTFIKNIVYLDNICKLKNIPVIHIYLDIPGVEQELLQLQGITMHYDLKVPGNTWHFDSGALDGSHHSAWCHTQWVERIRKLL